MALESTIGLTVKVSKVLPQTRTGAEDTEANFIADMKLLTFQTLGAIFAASGGWGDTKTDNSEDTFNKGAIKSAGTPQKATLDLTIGAEKDEQGVKDLMEVNGEDYAGDARMAIAIYENEDATEALGYFVGNILSANLTPVQNQVWKINTSISVFGRSYQNLAGLGV